MDNVFLSEFAKIFPEFNTAFGAGIVVFARIAGTLHYSPPFNRNEVPMIVKVSFVLLLTIIVTSVLKPTEIPKDTSLILSLVLNYSFGFLIGYIINVVIAAISAAGDIINSQIGVSSATALDPSVGTQTPLMTTFFTLLATVIFISIGGIYWTINAILKSFEVFPVFATGFPIERILNIDYLIKITFNTYIIGMQIAAPILLATLGQDIILGTISKTAPQVNVFQMSFLFKPVMGAMILNWVLPMLINVIIDYLNSFSSVF